MTEPQKEERAFAEESVLGILGRGATATVYLVSNPLVRGRKLAMKRFAPGVSLLAGRNLSSEANILRSLDHEFIALLVGEGHDQGGYYLLMEYIDGTTVDAFCDAGRLPVRERLALLRKILRGVEHAHSRFIVHADLKPTNVLVTRDGVPKLVDFGVAQWLVAAGGQPATARQGFSAGFAAPEQRSANEVTVRTDVYSMGVLAYLLLSGELPADAPQAQAKTMSAAVRGMDHAKASTIAGLRSTTPEALQHALVGDLDLWVRRALLPDPAERYASAAEMSADLDAYLAGGELTVNPASAFRRALLWSRQHPAISALATAVCLVLIASCTAVLVVHVRLVRQERLTEQRLLEDLQLTESFQSELSRSVAALPQSGPARDVLADGRTKALLQLAPAGPFSSTVNEELAREAADAACADAHTEGANARERMQKLSTLGAGMLHRVPASEREQIAARISACSGQ